MGPDVQAGSESANSTPDGWGIYQMKEGDDQWWVFHTQFGPMVLSDLADCEKEMEKMRKAIESLLEQGRSPEAFDLMAGHGYSQDESDVKF